MFRKKVKEDPTELELLKLRVNNLEKKVTELKKTPQVQAEEQKEIEVAAKLLSLANNGYSEEMKSALLEWSSKALSIATSYQL